MEDAVAAVGADGQGLGVVFEGVGWGLGALVDDVEGFALFEEGEVGSGTGAVDAAGRDVAGHAEVAGVGLAAHALELGDGDVVAFVFADSCDGEPGDGGQDDDGSEGDFELRFGHSVSDLYSTVRRGGRVVG